MNFEFHKLTVWLKNGKIRTVHFEPNKVNVITGISHTGKTAILGIIDYCLMSSIHRIPESLINENVLWYGISFGINNKAFTIARRAPSAGQISSDYYFSSIGEVPGLPRTNNTEAAIKDILEVEFSINKKIQMPYGGGSIAANSKISLRYFLMFNTISEDIIESSSTFFDKQNIDRYREALPRIFDLAVGIDDIDNILARERRDELEGELRRLERRNKRIFRKYEEFRAELSEITRQANEYALIEAPTEISSAVVALKSAIEKNVEALRNGSTLDMNRSTWTKRYDSITSEIYELNAKIRNAQRFSTEYKAYKANLGESLEDLKPLFHLRERNRELVKTSIYEDIINALESDFRDIKDAIRSKTPIDAKVTDLISELEGKVEDLKSSLELLGEEPKSFINEREKYLFLGEMKAKLALYADVSDNVQNFSDEHIKKIQGELSALEVRDVAEQRELFIKMFEEIVQTYIDITQDALANYRSYKPVFNYNEKKLQLRKPKSDSIEYVGSSSNYMFLHLFFFLGLHEVILRKNVPYVPSFLIMDQPSRPYYGGDTKIKILKNSDEANIRAAFQLLNAFLEVVNRDIKSKFQIIVFEHVPKETWEGLKHVHLVEEFNDGNALIPDVLIR